MSDGKVVIQTELDTKQIVQDINKLTNSLGSINTSRFTSQMNGLNNVLSETGKSLDEQKSKLAQLKNAFNNSTNVGQRNQLREQIRATETTVTSLQSTFNELSGTIGEVNRLNLDGVRREVTDLNGEFRTASVRVSESTSEISNNVEEIADSARETSSQVRREFQEMGDSIKEAGEKTKETGDKLTDGITKPILGAGAALLAIGITTDQALSKIQGQLGTTAEETEALKKVALDVYQNGYGESLEAVSEGLVTLQQNLKSTKHMTDETKESLLTNMFTLQDLFEVDPKELTSVLSVMQNSGFDDDLEHAMDILTYGFQNGANYSDELLDTMKEYAPQFVKMGISSEQAMNILIAGANSGAFKVDSIGDSIKEFAIRAIDGSKTTVAGFEAIGLNADEMAKKFGEGGESANAAYKQVLVGLAAMEDPIEQNTTGTNLMGTMWEDLGKKAVLSMSSAKDSIEGLTGTTDKATESNTSAANQFESALRKTRVALLPLATEVMNMATELLPSLTEGIKEVGEFLGSMDKETKQTIVKMALLAASVGPVIKVIGGLASGLGTLKNFLGAAALTETAVGAEAAAAGITSMVPALGTAAAAIAPFIAAAAGIGLVGYATYSTLTKEVIPSVDLFADHVKYTSKTIQDENGNMRESLEGTVTTISDSTKQAVQSYLDMDNGAKSAISDLYINNATITDQIAEDTKTKFWAMSKSIVDGYERQKNESITQLTELFANQKDITEKEQAEILEKNNKFYSDKEAKITESEVRINEILKAAKDGNRSLKEEEVAEITSLQNSMRENAVHALSEQETQAAVILQRMKDYDGRMTAEQVSEKIKALNDGRDQAIQTANDEYDQKIATITKMRDETGVITAEQAETMINNAKKQRDETVNAAQETRNGAVAKIEEMNTDISSSVNTSTGAILTNWDRLKSWWNSWAPQPKTVEVTTEVQAVSKGFSNSSFNNDFNNSNPYLRIGQKNYTGTNSLKTGLSYVNEHGYETANNSNVKMLDSGLAYLIGNHYSGGDGINTHMTTVNEMDRDITDKVGITVGKFVNILTSAISGQNSALNQVSNNTSELIETGEKGNQLNEKLATDMVKNWGANTGSFTGIQNEITTANTNKDKASKMKVEDNSNYARVKGIVDDLDSKLEELKDKASDTEDKSLKKQLDSQQKVLQKQKDVAQKEMELAKEVAENEIKYAKDSADQQVKIADEKKNKLTKIAEATTKAIKAKTEEEKSDALNKIDYKLKREEAASSKKLSQIQKEYNSELSNIEEITKARTNSIDAEIALLEEKATIESREDERKAANDNINMLSTKMANTKSQADKDSLSLQIKKSQKELNDKENTWNIEDAKAALEDEKAYLEEKATIEKSALQEEYESQKEHEEKKIAKIRDSYAEQKEETEAYYNKLLETDSLNAQVRYLLMQGDQQALVDLLNSYAPGWQDAGQSLVDSLLTGLNSGKQSVQDAINEMVGLRGSSAPPPNAYNTGTGKYEGYATGTSYNPRAGLYKVDEKGFETTNSGSVAYVSKGAAINNNMQSKKFLSDEISRQVALMRESYFQSQAQMQAQLISNITNANNSKTYNDHGQINFNVQNLNNYDTKSDIGQISNELGSYRQQQKKF